MPKHPKITNVTDLIIDIFHSVLWIHLAVDSELVFEHGEVKKTISITIVDDHEVEKDESFAVELYDATGGAKIGKHPKTVITIINDDGKRQILFSTVVSHCLYHD